MTYIEFAKVVLANPAKAYERLKAGLTPEEVTRISEVLLAKTDAEKKAELQDIESRLKALGHDDVAAAVKEEAEKIEVPGEEAKR